MMRKKGYKDISGQDNINDDAGKEIIIQHSIKQKSEEPVGENYGKLLCNIHTSNTYVYNNFNVKFLTIQLRSWLILYK